MLCRSTHTNPATQLPVLSFCATLSSLPRCWLLNEFQLGCWLFGCWLLSATVAQAQEQYELVAPQRAASSKATITATELRVVGADGRVTVYSREPHFDSTGGEWIGYFSPSANQVLRWPSINRGNMQIGELNGGNVQYRYSQMSIQSIGQYPERVVDKPVLPPTINPGLPPPTTPGLPPAIAPAEHVRDSTRIGNLSTSDFFGQLLAGTNERNPISPRSLRIATYDGRSAPNLLTRSSGFELGSTNHVDEASDWWISPAGAGMVRVQTYERGRVYAVSSQTNERVSLMPLAQDPRQLWRVTGAGRADNRYVLENAQFPGFCLANIAGGRVAMQPIHFAPTQLWVPLVPPPAPSFQPFYRTVRQEFHANPQLPPAQLELFNSHRYALMVLLGDKRAGAAVQQFRIPPGSSQVVSLDRDAGATVIETVELRNPLGVWESQQFVTAIPPSAFYDLSVYEEHLQSIAIDRTGKSPNQIEDINFVPKSVGWIPLPAGAGLPSVSRLDVYPRAQASNNPGAVRRLDPRQFDNSTPSNPLESLLQGLKTTTNEQALAPAPQTNLSQPPALPSVLAPPPSTTPPAAPQPDAPASPAPKARQSF
ncbi:MAG: hypothetical protein KDA72_04850 [Planctomycetales bacterium]|nr:hypothetical protein [Planctomycetales bacterium]